MTAKITEADRQLKCFFTILTVFLIFFGYYFVCPSYAQKKIKQSTSGDQSPAVVGRDVTIIYGVPQEVVQRLLKNLDEKDVAIEEREAKLKELAQKYKELEKRLDRRNAHERQGAKNAHPYRFVRDPGDPGRLW